MGTYRIVKFWSEVKYVDPAYRLEKRWLCFFWRACEKTKLRKIIYHNSHGDAMMALRKIKGLPKKSVVFQSGK